MLSRSWPITISVPPEDEYDARLEAALSARTYADLDRS
jgi:hypothetical protein